MSAKNFKFLNKIYYFRTFNKSIRSVKIYYINFIIHQQIFKIKLFDILLYVLCQKILNV